MPGWGVVGLDIDRCITTYTFKHIHYNAIKTRNGFGALKGELKITVVSVVMPNVNHNSN